MGAAGIDEHGHETAVCRMGRGQRVLLADENRAANTERLTARKQSKNSRKCKKGQGTAKTVLCPLWSAVFDWVFGFGYGPADRLLPGRDTLTGYSARKRFPRSVVAFCNYFDLIQAQYNGFSENCKDDILSAFDLFYDIGYGSKGALLPGRLTLTS